MASLTAEHLHAILPGAPEGDIEEELPSIHHVMREYQINTKLRFAAFIANVAKESGQLHYLEEIDEGWYLEGREDLGNIYEGDGPRFKGHGYIQITGRNNHSVVGQALGVDAISDPEILTRMPYAWLSAGYYWRYMSSWGDLNDYADAGDFESTVLGVRGGEDPDRRWYYDAAMAVLPDDLDVSEGEQTVTEPATERSETVANDVLVYTDDDSYIRARENDAYVWMLQGSNTPAKANGNGYIYVPGLPGGGPGSLAALPPTRADTLVSAADSNTWLRTASGSYFQGEGMSDHDLQVNQSGWVWDRTAWEAKAEEVAEEPEVAPIVLVYTDDDSYIRARENDAYMWMLQGANTPAKADESGYIYVPGLPGGGPDAAALPPTQADKLVSAADSNTWLRTASGSYFQGEGMSDHDLQVNLKGWVWDRTAWEAKPKDDRFWPVADTPPDPNSWSYVDQHPTRYDWVASVEKLARDLCKNFPVWCNTYYGHPPPEIVGGVDYSLVSMDVWNPGGRGDTLDWNVHTQVCDYVMNDPNPPYLAWVCSKYYLWTPGGGWTWYSNDESPATDYAHIYHLHMTFALNS